LSTQIKEKTTNPASGGENSERNTHAREEDKQINVAEKQERTTSRTEKM
jgi:hypothetical protein